MSTIYVNHYKPERNRQAGNKGLAIAGSSVIAAGAATETLDWLASDFGIQIPPYLKMIALGVLTAGFGYLINRVRNYIKHS